MNDARTFMHCPRCDYAEATLSASWSDERPRLRHMASGALWGLVMAWTLEPVARWSLLAFGESDWPILVPMAWCIAVLAVFVWGLADVVVDLVLRLMEFTRGVGR